MREVLEYLKEISKNKELVGVEVGVQQGINARNILMNSNIDCLYLVDPFVAYTDRDSSLPAPVIYDSDLVCMFEKTAEINVYPFRNKIRFLKITSLEAASFFNDNFLDFVYIDANHHYDYISKDIKAWYPKVKNGGLLGGHDWGIEDVRKAVTEFVVEHKLSLHSRNDEESTDWYIIK